MSTGSISTFHTTATPLAKVGARLSNKCKSTKPIQETSADQASVLTSTSMSEVDFNMLMQHITAALQIKPLSLNPGTHLVGMIGGDGNGDTQQQVQEEVHKQQNETNITPQIK